MVIHTFLAGFPQKTQRISKETDEILRGFDEFNWKKAKIPAGHRSLLEMQLFYPYTTPLRYPTDPFILLKHAL